MRKGSKGWRRWSEGRERGRGCYPDGCRQRSDRSAALRAVPEPPWVPRGRRREPTRRRRGRRRRGVSADEDGDDWRRRSDATPLPRAPPIRRGESVRRRSPTTPRSLRARARTRGGDRAREGARSAWCMRETDPFRNSSVVLRYRVAPPLPSSLLALFRPFEARKGERVCAPGSDFAPQEDLADVRYVHTRTCIHTYTHVYARGLAALNRSNRGDAAQIYTTITERM